MMSASQIGCQMYTLRDFTKTPGDLAKTLAKLNGKTMLQLLLEKLDPSIWFEIDTYWIAHGGGDPVQWIDKVSGRIPCVHLKDMGITSKREQFMAEVGEGNLNWPAIIDAC